MTLYSQKLYWSGATPPEQFAVNTAADPVERGGTGEIETDEHDKGVRHVSVPGVFPRGVPVPPYLIQIECDSPFFKLAGTVQENPWYPFPFPARSERKIFAGTDARRVEPS